MAIFTASTNAEVLAYLKEQAPNAEIHVDDEVAAKYSANGRAQDNIEGKILAYVAAQDSAVFCRPRVNITFLSCHRVPILVP